MQRYSTPAPANAPGLPVIRTQAKLSHESLTAHRIAVSIYQPRGAKVQAAPLLDFVLPARISQRQNNTPCTPARRDMHHPVPQARPMCGPKVGARKRSKSEDATPM